MISDAPIAVADAAPGGVLTKTDAFISAARSAAADAHSRWFEQSAQCDLGIKALVALSALPEAQVRGLIRAPGAAQDAPGLALASLPAQTIAQRPDVFAAEREVFTAAALVAGAQAQRWPRLTINGSIGPAQFGLAGVDKSLTSWSLGPVSLVVLFLAIALKPHLRRYDNK